MGVTLSLPWSLSPREEESKPKDKPQKTGECPLPPPHYPDVQGNITGGAAAFWGSLPQKGSLPGVRSLITARGLWQSCRAVSTVQRCASLWPLGSSGGLSSIRGVCNQSRAQSSSPSCSDRVQPRGGEEGGEDLPVHAPEAAAHLVRPPLQLGHTRNEGHSRT